MAKGSIRSAAWFVALAVLLGCMASGGALAISPEQYRAALEENVEAYSGAKTWRAVAGQLCADEAGVRDGDGSFAITDDQGNDYLATSAARISICGGVRDGEIVSLDVYIAPMGGFTREYEYQAFSLSEIAFESLLGSASYSDMSAYLFLYDVYPYAMWSRDAELKDNTRSITTALGGVKYRIEAASSRSDSSVSLRVDALGASDEDDAAAARENLNANYAFESICSLVYELEVCQKSCSALLRQGSVGEEPDHLMGDMRTCAREYYALGAENYAKLATLTALLNDGFDGMLAAIDALEEGGSGSVEALEAAVSSMTEALRTMY